MFHNSSNKEAIKIILLFHNLFSNNYLQINTYICVGFNYSDKKRKTMDIEELRRYCLSQKNATEDMLFDEEYLIFRVFNKWFVVINLNDAELTISVKCDPAQAIELRERYRCVEAAWHFNKKYWNSIILNQDMNDETVKYWVRHSIEEVVKKLPKKIQQEYFDES